MEVPQEDSEQLEKRVEEQLERLKSSDSFVREQAAFELGKLQSESSLSALQDALYDQNEFVVNRVIEALAKQGFVAFDVYLKALKDDSPIIRAKALEYLGMTGGLDAIPVLMELFEDDKSDFRLNALTALGKTRNAVLVPVFLKLLNDEDESIQMAAVVALNRIDRPGRLPRKVLGCRQLSPQAKWDTLEAMSIVNYKDVWGRLRFDIKNVETLCEEALTDENEEVRLGAQALLNWMGGDRLLLKPSDSKDFEGRSDLLRPVISSPSQTTPEKLLIASHKPEFEPPPKPLKISFWKKFFRRREI